MDWLQFISTTISSLAWPSIAAYTLFLVRNQLSPLARRLTELSLPGGAKAQFSHELAEGKNQAINLVASDLSIEGAEISKPTVETQLTAKDKIHAIYANTNEFLQEKIRTLPLDKRQSPGHFIIDNFAKTRPDDKIYDLYDKIRDINYAASNSSSDSITNDEAIEFDRLCSLFKDRFQQRFGEWRNATENRSQESLVKTDFPRS